MRSSRLRAGLALLKRGEAARVVVIGAVCELNEVLMFSKDFAELTDLLQLISPRTCTQSLTMTARPPAPLPQKLWHILNLYFGSFKASADGSVTLFLFSRSAVLLDDGILTSLNPFQHSTWSTISDFSGWSIRTSALELGHQARMAK